MFLRIFNENQYFIRYFDVRDKNEKNIDKIYSLQITEENCDVAYFSNTLEDQIILTKSQLKNKITKYLSFKIFFSIAIDKMIKFGTIISA